MDSHLTGTGAQGTIAHINVITEEDTRTMGGGGEIDGFLAASSLKGQLHSAGYVF
jgi:hypothetical protein